MKRFILRAIEWYQAGRDGRPSPCRFSPSCSHYAHEAVSVHGAGRGTWLAVRRLIRCRPFGPSGFDPVPEPRSHQHDANTSSSSATSTLVNTGRAH
ncbi:MAG: membrane protein insertion efficiency factor YidD [Acidimicrobiales bacterium mtb01]|nr:membrane protein insertion efficiency factor YidD [Actinomycetota bacterium]TEX46808.1 MAG: membrane protein insertion efficiency factor YidD [Acidimicrobiales bacterium mtb01]